MVDFCFKCDIAFCVLTSMQLESHEHALPGIFVKFKILEFANLIILPCIFYRFLPIFSFSKSSVTNLSMLKRTRNIALIKPGTLHSVQAGYSTGWDRLDLLQNFCNTLIRKQFLSLCGTWQIKYCCIEYGETLTNSSTRDILYFMRTLDTRSFCISSADISDKTQSQQSSLFKDAEQIRVMYGIWCRSDSSLSAPILLQFYIDCRGSMIDLLRFYLIYLQFI